ncbi:putative RNA-directed DNA polymerase from transposon X-element [Trichonephila clavipes]|nr:putative RNA-directed DNA polymerase from transposon X-element [Trichonephila clavipes]
MVASSSSVILTLLAHADDQGEGHSRGAPLQHAEIKKKIARHEIIKNMSFTRNGKIRFSTLDTHLDVAIGRLGENISEALVAASKPKFKPAPIKLPPDIRSKIRHRNRVRRFWQRSRDPALKNELRTISNEVTSDIRHLSRARWEKTIEELSPETGTLWRCTSFHKKPFHHIPSLKDALGSIAVAPIEKAEVIADSLQKQFEPNTDVENPRFSAHIQRKVQRFLDSPTCMDQEKTSPSEIQGFIKNLKPNKSPGIDLITNRILKNLPTKFIIFIALLFNMLLENCCFPGMSQTLNCLISRKCKLPIRHKVLLYKLFLRPILLYASPIWASAAVTHLKKLHVFQNKHLRKITNAPWFVRSEILHKDLKIDPILDFIKNQSKKLFDRLPQILNQSLRVIPAYDNSVPSSAKRPRSALHHIYQHFPVLKRLRRS